MRLSNQVVILALLLPSLGGMAIRGGAQIAATDKKATAEQLRGVLASEPENTSEEQTVSAARHRLEKILERREFAQTGRADPLAPWREKISRWIRELISRLFGPAWRSARAGEAAVWVMILLIFLAFAVWLGRLFAGSRLQSFNLEPPEAAGRTWRDWAREAREAARQGRHREAMHAAYWTAVYRLEELGAWNRDRARTPREYLRLLGARKERGAHDETTFTATPAQRAALQDLTERFEVTWYGYGETSESDFHHAMAQLEQLGCRLS